jgi:hypothetical protein
VNDVFTRADTYQGHAFPEIAGSERIPPAGNNRRYPSCAGHITTGFTSAVLEKTYLQLNPDMLSSPYQGM